MKAAMLWGMVLGGVICLAVAGSAHGQRLGLPEGAFYYQPAATVFGAEAIWVNPAGLSLYEASSFQLLADQADDKFARTWGAVFMRDRVGLGYRRVHNPNGADWQEYVYAVAMKLGSKFHVGGSYRYFKEAPEELYKDHLWSVGLMGGEGRVRVGALWSNLNHSRDIDGRRTETEQRYSVAVRPIGKSLTLSVDMLLSTGMKPADADFVYHLELAHEKGLYLNGFVDSHKNFQIGMRANLLKYLLGTKSSFASDGRHRRTTVFLGGTNLSQPTILHPLARRLEVGMSGSTAENPPRPWIGRRQIPFVQLLLELRRAASDPSIGEMVLSLDNLSLGFAQAQELRRAIERFRSGGKQVTCHVSYPNNVGYYVASAADRILIPPVSELRLVGLRAELTFYAGTLDKLGIKADMVRRGEFKTAAETYARREASSANQEQVNRLLDDLYEQLVSAIAAGRAMTTDSVKSLIDNGPLTSRQALTAGLVDGLSYRDEVNDSLPLHMRRISFRGYLEDTVANDGWPECPELAVVVAEGEIARGRGPMAPFRGQSVLSPAAVGTGFDQALGDPGVAGIVMRIDSPGGDALVGDEIHRRVELARKDRPLVVSMANVAASGGYYIAMPASTLFADEGTIAGSIGIYGGKANFSGLYDKIDLGKELYRRGRYAGMMSTARPFTDDERAKLQSEIDAFYSHFLELVARNRSLSVDSIGRLAEGQVWTGREAVAVGLVDYVGGADDALDFLAKSLQIEEYRTKVYPQKRPLIILPAQPIFRLMAAAFWPGADRLGLEDNLQLPTLPDGLYARIPFDIIVD
jgi:protease-4